MQQRESSSRAPAKQSHVSVTEVEQGTSTHSVGIDLDKTTFHLVALGAAGKVLVRKSLIPSYQPIWNPMTAGVANNEYHANVFLLRTSLTW
jgi:hypothetical protein